MSMDMSYSVENKVFKSVEGLVPTRIGVGNKIGDLTKFEIIETIGKCSALREAMKFALNEKDSLVHVEDIVNSDMHEIFDSLMQDFFKSMKKIGEGWGNLLFGALDTIERDMFLIDQSLKLAKKKTHDESTLAMLELLTGVRRNKTEIFSNEYGSRLLKMLIKQNEEAVVSSYTKIAGLIGLLQNTKVEEKKTKRLIFDISKFKEKYLEEYTVLNYEIDYFFDVSNEEANEMRITVKESGIYED